MNQAVLNANPKLFTGFKIEAEVTLLRSYEEIDGEMVDVTPHDEARHIFIFQVRVGDRIGRIMSPAFNVCDHDAEQQRDKVLEASVPFIQKSIEGVL
jgi:hypothetical protein